MSNSPWGAIQTQLVLARGVRWINTASHGGFLVSQRFANLHFSPAAVKRGKQWGSYLAYEEDCDATIIMYETRAFDDLLGYTRNHDTERLESLSRWHADYLIERGITPDPVGLKFFNDNRLRDRMYQDRSPDLIVSAVGDWHKDCPKGYVLVTTADDSRWLVPAKEYDNRNGVITLLSTFTFSQFQGQNGTVQS